MKKYTKTLSLLLAALLCLSLVGCGNTSKSPSDVSGKEESSGEDKMPEETPKEDGANSEEFVDDDIHTEAPLCYIFKNFEELASLRAAQLKGDDAMQKYTATTEAGMNQIETADEAEDVFHEIGNRSIPVLDTECGVKLTSLEYTPEKNLFELFYRTVENNAMLRITVYFNPEEFVIYDKWTLIDSGSSSDVDFQVYDLNTDGQYFTHTAVVQSEACCFDATIRADFPDGAEGLARVMENVHLTTILEQIGK